MSNDSPAPTAGNICLGEWEKTGPRRFKSVHPAYNYNWDTPGITADGIKVVSIFIQIVQVTVSPDGNSFTGAFTWDSYDFNGNFLPGTHLDGTMTGKRITVS